MSEPVMTVNEYGDKSWRKENAELHRLGGPAVEYANGSRSWYINGKLHRTDGPAIEWASGVKEWWVDGKRYSEDSIMVKLLKRKINLKEIRGNNERDKRGISQTRIL